MVITNLVILFENVFEYYRRYIDNTTAMKQVTMDMFFIINKSYTIWISISFSILVRQLHMLLMSPPLEDTYADYFKSVKPDTNDNRIIIIKIKGFVRNLNLIGLLSMKDFINIIITGIDSTVVVLTLDISLESLIPYLYYAF